MMIRFKSECRMTWVQDGGSEGDGHSEEVCERVPIQDWDVTPINITTVPYKKGAALPSGYFINVVHFPELHLWEDSPYSDYRYKIRVEYSNSSVAWLSFSSPELEGEVFSPLNLSSSYISLNFKNVSQLSPGTYNAVVYIEAYGIEASAEHFVEHNPTPINVNFVVEAGDDASGVYADKKDYYVTYNKTTGVLSGDTLITIYNIIPDVVSLGKKPYGLSFLWSGSFDPVRTMLQMKLSSTALSAGDYTETLTLIYDGVNSEEDVRIHLKVVEGSVPTPEDFDVVPKIFSYIVAKQPNEFKSGTASLVNPQELNITVAVKPSFIDKAVISGDQLRFTTVGSSALAVGNYSGEIVLQSGSVTKKVMIYMKVAQGLTSDFKGKAYYFALDGHKVTITKTNPIASYAVIEMNMFFKAFGEEYREIQRYSYPYFKDKIEFEPGEDVQDFFIRCKSCASAGYQMNLAPVSISVKEYDAEDNELQESVLKSIFFAPGKTPKCFPLWTDFGVRRTFPESKIRLNLDVKKDYDILARLYAQYSERRPSVSPVMEVHAFDFNRESFSAGDKQFLDFQGYQLIPFPAPGSVVHLLFETHNLVLDWFSCPGEYQKKYEFKHLFDESGRQKFGSLETENIVLNTGWLLREEIAVVNAILKSRICFLYIEGAWVAVKATSKKNEIYDTLSSKYNMEIEFNIKTDER